MKLKPRKERQRQKKDSEALFILVFQERYLRACFVVAVGIMQEFEWDTAWTQSNKREKQILNFPGSWANKEKRKFIEPGRIYFFLFLAFLPLDSRIWCCPSVAIKIIKQHKDIPFSNFSSDKLKLEKEKASENL